MKRSFQSKQLTHSTAALVLLYAPSSTGMVSPLFSELYFPRLERKKEAIERKILAWSKGCACACFLPSLSFSLSSPLLSSPLLPLLLLSFSLNLSFQAKEEHLAKFPIEGKKRHHKQKLVRSNAMQCNATND